MERVCVNLNELINQSKTNSSYYFTGQVLMTITSILIELSVIRTQPRVFESFVEVCFDIVAKYNEGPDRMLRETVF